ncbi:beta-ketoacyl-[acyl-carrier-protein] synthase family protein [Flavobacterium silvaticum]|uniref:3-oxoacyl-[acyl-carrier-protein] synthase 1 n=1 Tax=Flavobacterium silvaticum TaxID=1852020 RepID=A0A972JIF9_9FLAO|nr:beta-ketoacyl-[acyl-carrier-protein] synthase family protein [Flavobacterium silvaticum]NMH28980.1 beta-ketoacyl-[acyl-carrier-protein] synthase family protein [Flavobacterium silvaticum]
MNPQKKRVVITGIGICSPNGITIPEFLHSIQNGISGIRFDPQLEALGFSCQISGKPQIPESYILNYLTELEQRQFNSNGILYGLIAGLDAWKDAGLKPNDDVDFDSGVIFGTGTSGIDKFRESIYKIDDMQTRRLGSTSVIQTMASGISAYLGGKLGLGNIVTTNSSACTTGTEALLLAYDRIKSGKAKRILAGSTSDSGPYIWGGFDALKVCTYKYNHNPEAGSRPMSETASGFVPAAGSGAYVIEDLESALERGADIYAEILGGEVNSGGQRGQGSMTAPNPVAVQRCIRNAILDSGISAKDIDMVNGHLTATIKDGLEISNWAEALGRKGSDFPYINSLKSMVGHCLSGSGSVEIVASLLQIKHQFVFPNINCEDVHPEITALIDASKIPTQKIEMPVNIVAKASFGFGDVNGCVIFKKY